MVKRAFADWSRPGMRRFKTVLHHHAIEPVHLFSYAPGKNAADITLCLNAMDLVNTGQFDGVCLVSSDSDLTPLAFCLRREGVRVHGFDRSGGMKRCCWSCVAQRTELSRTSAQDEFFPACSTFSSSSRREPCSY
ncbi:MAG: NYN domain-containing protein [Hydrogenophaga sp.]|nr:NYN domain-containing protein [Hydrogenophaga sp.]